MSKKLLDLDFSDISGGIKKKTAEEAEQEVLQPEQPKEDQPELTGITLIVEQDGLQVEKDLAECTDEEFLSWCFTVLPPDFPLKEKQVEGLSGKMKVFKAIVGLGRRRLLSRKGPKESLVN